MKWKLIQDCRKLARVSRGFYKCAGCSEVVPNTTVKDGARVKNTFVDHIIPVVDPSVGWVSWDDTIDKLFAELDNLQLLCGNCHKEKSDEERVIANARRKEEKKRNL